MLEELSDFELEDLKESEEEYQPIDNDDILKQTIQNVSFKELALGDVQLSVDKNVSPMPFKVADMEEIGLDESEQRPRSFASWRLHKKNMQ